MVAGRGSCPNPNTHRSAVDLETQRRSTSSAHLPRLFASVRLRVSGHSARVARAVYARQSGGSGLPWSPVVDALQRFTHQRGALAVRQAIGDAKGVHTLRVAQHADRARPVGAPHAALEAERIEDAGERIPDV